MAKEKEKEHKSHSAGFILALLCFAAAAFFKFAVKGYSTLALVCAAAGAFIIVFILVKKVVKVVFSILLVACLFCFAMVEVPVIQGAAGTANSDADYLIVLGAAVHGDHPSLSMVNRLDAALAYLQTHPDCVAVVTGGKGNGENKTEAQMMYEWLVDKGIDPQRIVKEEYATSTEENLRFSFSLITAMNGGRPIEPGEVAVVSSEYHLYRTQYLAQNQGVQVDTVPAHTSKVLLMVNNFIREGFAMIYYWVVG